MSKDIYMAGGREYSVGGNPRDKSRHTIATRLVTVILILGLGALALGAYRGWDAGDIGDLFIKIITPITALLGMLIGFLTKAE